MEEQFEDLLQNSGVSELHAANKGHYYPASTQKFSLHLIWPGWQVLIVGHWSKLETQVFMSETQSKRPLVKQLTDAWLDARSLATQLVLLVTH